MKRRRPKSRAVVRPKHAGKGASHSQQAANPPKPPQRWLFRVLALVVVPLLFLGLLEIGLRLGGYGYDTTFFKKARINGRDLLVNNDSFVLRFFPPQLTRLPEPLRMEAQKPPDTCRIFVLGESAALGDPSPQYGAWRYLQTLLADRFPDRKFEVVNVSITAINSHVILPIARECAGRQGDFWIVYMGNNEMVGPFGAASVFGAQAPPVWTVRLNLGLQETRVGQWLTGLARDLKFKSNQSGSWRGMEMFLGNQILPDDRRKEQVYRNFQQNLGDILQAGLGSGAQVVLNTVAVNLKDCSPFASLPPARLPADCQRLASEAARAHREGRDEDAIGLFDKAVKLQPLAADLQYGFAQCLWGVKDFAAAREHFQKACDSDALPFRADSRINELIRQAARQSSNSNLLFFDAATALASDTPGKICGDETFLEHVHLNFDGNYRLARGWAETIASRLRDGGNSKGTSHHWLSQAKCEERLALTDWNRMLIDLEELRRRLKPPLASQINNSQELEVLSNKYNLLQQRADAGAAARVRALCLDDIRCDPDDFLLLVNYGDFLEGIKDWKEAAATWKQAEALMPQYYLYYFQEGRMLENGGQLEEAESAIQKALHLYPRMTAGWFELSNIHTREGKYDLALQECERAVRLEPGQPTFFICLGTLLARMNRHSDAIEQFRKAIEIEPDHWDVRLAIAMELARADRTTEASSEFEEVVRRWPDRIQGHLDFGQFLLQHGLRDRAAREFQEVLRLDPGNQTARQNLNSFQ